MRALISKVLTGSMVAGAALLVSACGGDTDAGANNTADLGTDTMMESNDVTAVDAGTGVDTNMAMDTNMTDMNMSGNATDVAADNALNGM